MSRYFRGSVGSVSSLKDADELELQHEPVTSRRNTAELYSLHNQTSSPQLSELPFHRTAYTALNDSEDPLTSLRAPEALPYETAYEPSHGFEDQQTPLSASKVPYQDHARIREKTPQRLPSPLKREADFINKWWLWEVLAWITSLISLIAIISVLAVYNGIFGRTSHTGHDLTLAGKPLPRWPYSITLNSLIAVFSTVFKACTAVPITEGKQQQI